MKFIVIIIIYIYYTMNKIFKINVTRKKKFIQKYTIQNNIIVELFLYTTKTTISIAVVFFKLYGAVLSVVAI